MATKIETLRAPRQVSPWIVIGAAAALIAALAVLTVSETTVTPTREAAVTVTRVTSDAAEMAEVKSAVAHRYMVERFGIDGSVASRTSEAHASWALKAGIASEYLAERFDARAPGVGDLDNRGTEGRIDTAAEIAWLKAHLAAVGER